MKNKGNFFVIQVLLLFVFTSFSMAQQEDKDITKKATEAYKKGQEVKKKVDEAIDKGKKAKKIVDLMFGILPNSDGKVNNVSNMNVNYTENLKSSVQMYDKKFFTAKNTITDWGRKNEVTTVETRDINLSLLEYNPSLFRFSLWSDLSLKLYFAVGAKYMEETTRYSYDEWDNVGNNVMHPMWIIQEKKDRKTYLPEASLIFSEVDSNRFKWNLHSSYQFRNVEKIKLERYDSLLEVVDDSAPLPTGYTYKTSTLYFSDDQTKKSTGFSLKTSMQFSVYFGVLGFDLYYMYKKGDSILFMRDIDDNGVTYYDSEAITTKQTRIDVNIYYQMTYLKFLGVEPILKFGWQKQELLNNGEKDKQMSYNKYDFGIAFKY